MVSALACPAIASRRAVASTRRLLHLIDPCGHGDHLIAALKERVRFSIGATGKESTS